VMLYTAQPTQILLFSVQIENKVSPD
jgi:hypothetical protein